MLKPSNMRGNYIVTFFFFFLPSSLWSVGPLKSLSTSTRCMTPSWKTELMATLLLPEKWLFIFCACNQLPEQDNLKSKWEIIIWNVKCIFTLKSYFQSVEIIVVDIFASSVVLAVWNRCLYLWVHSLFMLVS